jgi:SAM-dependent methyltransferase
MTSRQSSANRSVFQEKYKPNPGRLMRFALNRFFGTLSHMLEQIEARTVFDAGCGEAYVLKNMLEPRFSKIYGADLYYDVVEYVATTYPHIPVFCSNLQAIPLPDNAVDLSICLEVLEHVGEPEIALAELHRVTRKYVILSVPNEPFWRIGNMVRGAYWRDWGNTPEHINHWSIGGFKRFVGERFNIIASATPVTWSFVLAEKR